MKTKTIKSVLRKKFNEFAESIEDKAVRDLVKKNTIITGGSIASMLLREKVNDYDLYFTNKETVVAVANYYVERFSGTTKFKDGGDVSIRVDASSDRVRIVVRSAGVASEEGADSYQYFEGTDGDEAEEYSAAAIADVVDDDTKPKYRPVFLSSNAITLSQGVQLILRFYGEPDKIHENYDFVHCTNYWASKDGSLTLRPDALEALLTKELRYIGSKYPLCSLVRVRKFIRRDWTITAGQILKICVNLQSFNLNDVEVLEDQLTGVDVAYFHEVIDILKKKDKKEVDSAYLMTVIDRIF